MPIIKSAKKALRQTKKRTLRNLAQKSFLKSEFRKAKGKVDVKTVSRLYSLADRAAKTGVIHKNKAGRIKSRLSKLLKKPKK